MGIFAVPSAMQVKKQSDTILRTRGEKRRSSTKLKTSWFSRQTFIKTGGEGMERPLRVLDTEKVNPATTEIDRMSPLEIVQAINAEDAKVAQAVQQVLPDIARAIEGIAAKLRLGGRLIYAGAGTSGCLGAFNASRCPPQFNIWSRIVITSIASRQTGHGCG